MSKFDLTEDYVSCLQVLHEFCQDVEAVGEEKMGEEWPDLLVTYYKARKLVRDESEDE